MPLLDNTWVLVALSVALLMSAVSVVTAIVCLVRLRRQTDLSIKLYRQLEHNLQLITNSTIGMGKKIVAMEKGESAAPETQLNLKNEPGIPQPKLHQAPAQDNNMNDAIMLLNAGLATEEVARRCSISRAEASLLKLMHAHADTVSAA